MHTCYVIGGTKSVGGAEAIVEECAKAGLNGA